MQPVSGNCRLIHTKSNFMKFSMCILIMLLSMNQGFSQKAEKALSGSYSSEEIASIKKQDPSKIDVLMYGLKHATYLIDFPKGKEVQIDQEFTLPDGKYTYVDLGLKILDVNQYFKISGTDKVLVVKSMWVLNNEIKTAKK